ncbi:DUF6183 family protein [Sandaracinus amylolyticus]|uniref:DUF6183 family protein n=1 Tax=Sandaracinus amylolyticus TaxID=927083 RepID=UPI001F162709|nr:DUF6183 family protein [Sandaracinus amylolyticus]UJR84785.1 Hypothetical protein I5071_68640 [Sandaracinus amylolyticus]
MSSNDLDDVDELVGAFVAGFSRYDSSAHRDRLRALFDQGGPAALLAVGDRLETRSLRWRTEARQHLLDDVTQLLATRPGIEHVRACLALLSRPLGARRGPERAVDLAMFQPLEVLLAAITGGCAADVLACWIQELVVGGIRLDRHPVIAAYWRALAHPLARLPLFLYDWERGLGDHVLRPHDVVHGWPGGWTWSAPESLAGASPPTTIETVALPATMREPTAVVLGSPLEPREVPPSWREPILSDVAGAWSIADGALAPTREVIALAWADLVRRAPRSRQPVRDLVELSASGALRALFGAIARGGPYDRGGLGAGSRLRAWRLLAEGCGAPPDAGLEQIAHAAVDCRWASFRVTGLHADEGWDFGIACVRADARTLLLKVGTAAD